MSNKHDIFDDILSSDLQQAVSSGVLKIGRAIPEPSAEEPPDDQLLLLLEDKLDPGEQRLLEKQLQRCPYSADRVEILREVIDANQRVRLSPESREVVAADSRIARLVFSVSEKADRMMRWLRGSDDPVLLDPVGVPTRTSPGTAAATEEKHFYKFIRRFGDWDAVIQVESVHRGVDLRVELHREGHPLQDARAELRRRGKLLESVRVREGVAGFSELGIDRYELEIKGQQDASLGLLTLDFLQEDPTQD